MAKQLAVRTGDSFIGADGDNWLVIEVKPFGRVDLFCDKRSLFCEMSTKEARFSMSHRQAGYNLDSAAL